MGFFVFILIVAVVWLLSEVSGLKATIGRLDERVVGLKSELHEAIARLQRVETQARDTTTRRVEPERAAPVVTPAPAPVKPVRADEHAAPATPPVVAPTAPIRKQPEVPAPPVAAAPMSPPAAPTLPPEPAPAPVSAAAAATTATRDRDESWEMVVGTSWLNKIGVLVSIVGVALLVSYSFAHIGPGGRVAIGYLLSVSMLGGGVILERRDTFRNYAYGLIAGGWAGIYFTTFAMHDVAAAKIIDSDLLAVALLSVVAAGMIAHSLHYRSQVVTSLAFIVAYTTLALSPLSGFALAASVPLAVAMLVVAQYFGWASIAVLGIAATYGTFVVRSEVFPGTGLDRESVLPYATLGSYWLAFEAAEIVALWRRRHLAGASRGAAPVSMLALNLVGFVGAVIITAPGDNPQLFSTFLFGTSAAYIVSAAIRAWIAPDWRARPDNDAFGSTHAATAAAAGLTAIAIGLRFNGGRETLARLFEAELLVSAGLLLADIWLRRMGSLAFAIAGVSGWLRAADVGGNTGHLLLWSFTPATTSVVLGLIAMAAYANREALHRRRESLVWLETGYTWIAAVAIATASLIEFTPAHWGLALLVLAVTLLETGFRRTREYIYQAYLAGVFGSYAIFVSFIGHAEANGLIPRWGAAPTTTDEWVVLPSAILLTAFAAWRLFRGQAGVEVPSRSIAAASSATLTTAFLVVFEWRVMAPNAIAPTWALTALALVLLGAWRRTAALRWQGYVVALIAALRSVQPLLDGPPESASQTAGIAIVIAVLYAAGYWGRRALFAATPDAKAAESPEAAVTASLSLVATGAFALLKWRVLPDDMIAPAWAATGLVLLALGIYRLKAGQRLQGYAMLALGLLRTDTLLLGQPVAAATLAWWSALVVSLSYAGAWHARRARPRTNDPALVPGAVSALATLVLITLESRVLADVLVGPAWTATAIVLLAVGLLRDGSRDATRQITADLRWQSYAVLGAGAWRSANAVFTTLEATTAAIVWLAVVIGALYLAGVVVRRSAATAKSAGFAQPIDDFAGAAALLGATGLLSALIVDQVRPSAITLALGLQGLGLMLGGLMTRERILRLSGLALLLACILKLFLYDLRELEALARIMSFVILGLSLLAISWTYTRYREQIRKFL